MSEALPDAPRPGATDPPHDPPHDPRGEPAIARRAASSPARRRLRTLVVTVTVAACALAGAGGAWAWRAHEAEQEQQARDEAAEQAAEQLAAERAAAVAAARETDVRLWKAEVSRASRAAAAAEQADERETLTLAVGQARSTLEAATDEVDDASVTTALAEAIEHAEALAAKETITPAELREGRAALVAAATAAADAHTAWLEARAREAQEEARDGGGGGGGGDCRTTYGGPPFYTSPPTEGGDGSNGRLPESALTPTSWGRDSQGTRYYLRTDATAALERLNQAFRAEFGHDLDLDLTYRDYETQVAMREALGPIAAVPGTSRHGTGLALDVPELPCEYGWDTDQREWLVEHGPAYGWVSPRWARENGSNPEYWHYEFTG